MKKLTLALCLLFVFAMVVRADDVVPEKLKALHKGHVNLIKKFGHEIFLTGKHSFNPKFKTIISTYQLEKSVSVCAHVKEKVFYGEGKIEKTEHGVKMHWVLKVQVGDAFKTLAFAIAFNTQDNAYSRTLTIDKEVSDPVRSGSACWDCLLAKAPECNGTCGAPWENWVCWLSCAAQHLLPFVGACYSACF
jgi:hypothetical protein